MLDGGVGVGGVLGVFVVFVPYSLGCGEGMYVFWSGVNVLFFCGVG